MPTLALALLLLLAACAQAPPPAAPAWGPLPPLAQAAVAEWRVWGSIERLGWPAEPPAETAATPARFARLLAYWAAVPGGAGIAAALRRQRAALADDPLAPNGPEGGPPLAATPEPMRTYGQPFWSAAFIAAVARAAGIPRADLPSAISHARYIDAALARALAHPDDAAFRPEDPAAMAPRPGDLLCADRSPAAPLTHWQDRLAETGHNRPMHCDVVVRTSPGEVAAVGGNVDDLVVLRRLPADAAGRVLPAPPGESRFFLLLAARR